MIRTLVLFVLILALVMAALPAQARGIGGETNKATTMTLSGIQGGTIPLADGTRLDLYTLYPAQGNRPARWFACLVIAYPATCGYVPAVDVDVY